MTCEPAASGPKKRVTHENGFDYRLNGSAIEVHYPCNDVIIVMASCIAGPHHTGTVTATSGAPTIDLTRGEPVRIIVVNRLPEHTAVHWHGIELESYYDGVPGFSGAGRRLTPLIAPGDSFEVRFTPPRTGTFIYHTHADEERQQLAGLAGPFVFCKLAPGADVTRGHRNADPLLY